MTTSTHQTAHGATHTTGPADTSARFAVTRYVPVPRSTPTGSTETATLAAPTSVPASKSGTGTPPRSVTALRFPGAAFPPHRTGLRALWTPSLVDRLRTPLTRYHE